jgi:L-alanine-DL-glutamate epimerase-like enolase superfamily enzyme
MIFRCVATGARLGADFNDDAAGWSAPRRMVRSVSEIVRRFPRRERRSRIGGVRIVGCPSLRARQIGGELLQMLDDRFAVTPAARFALECALLDLLSQVEGVPLRRLLAGDASDAVSVNGILGALATLTAADLQRPQRRVSVW